MNTRQKFSLHLCTGCQLFPALWLRQRVGRRRRFRRTRQKRRLRFQWRRRSGSWSQTCKCGNGRWLQIWKCWTGSGRWSGQQSSNGWWRKLVWRTYVAVKKVSDDSTAVAWTSVYVSQVEIPVTLKCHTYLSEDDDIWMSTEDLHSPSSPCYQSANEDAVVPEDAACDHASASGSCTCFVTSL